MRREKGTFGFLAECSNSSSCCTLSKTADCLHCGTQARSVPSRTHTRDPPVSVLRHAVAMYMTETVRCPESPRLPQKHGAFLQFEHFSEGKVFFSEVSCDSAL